MSIVKHRNKHFAALLYVAAFLTAAIGLNANAQESSASKWDIRLGAGAVAVSAPWAAANDQGALFPYFDISKGNWRFNGTNLVGYQMQLSKSFGVSVGIGARRDGYDSDNIWLNKLKKHQIFDGYIEPDTEAVVNYGVTYGWLALEASKDVSNKSDSNSVSLSFEMPVYQFNNGSRISATAAIDWYDSNYVHYYYGVAGEQVSNSVGRVAYHISAATNFGLGIGALYPISDRWSVMGIISRTKLDDNIVNSPLVDSDYQDSAALVFVFQL